MKPSAAYRDFNKQPNVGAVCFKVLDPVTLKVVNWCHHLKVEGYADESFITDEITEVQLHLGEQLYLRIFIHLIFY